MGSPAAPHGGAFTPARVANALAEPMQEDELMRGNRQEAGARAEKGQEQQTREGLEEHTHKRTRLAVDRRPTC